MIENNHEKHRVKLRVLAENNGVPVYGLTIPRCIALDFLTNATFTVAKSGTAIIAEPVL